MDHHSKSSAEKQRFHVAEHEHLQEAPGAEPSSGEVPAGATDREAGRSRRAFLWRSMVAGAVVLPAAFGAPSIAGASNQRLAQRIRDQIALLENRLQTTTNGRIRDRLQQLINDLRRRLSELEPPDLPPEPPTPPDTPEPPPDPPGPPVIEDMLDRVFGRIQNRMPQVFASLRRHATDHRDFLRNRIQFLRATPRRQPEFQNLRQDDLRQFAELARDIENTAVGAYLALLPMIEDETTFRAVARIAFVEARHAGLLNVALGFSISSSDESFETELSIRDVRRRLDPFIADLREGPPLEAEELQTDIDILNFALAIEFLKAELYNVNVRRLLRV